jgi:hypothetical protein
MPPKKADRAIDALYELQPGEFTKSRDELARRLRREGRREEADAVKALRKPTAAAWALNQIARRRAADVKRLLAAGKRLRKAHEALLKGGDRAALQAATAEERALVDELARDALALAAESGAASSTALDERIRNTLHAVALDEETAKDLVGGRLVHDREAVGTFGAGAGAPGASAPARTARKERQADRRPLERAVAAAKQAEQKTGRAHAQAVKKSERAARAAERARDALRDAQRQEQAAAAELERAKRAVAAAERKLR